jgi:hypothetical protein
VFQGTHDNISRLCRFLMAKKFTRNVDAADDAADTGQADKKT